MGNKTNQCIFCDLINDPQTYLLNKVLYEDEIFIMFYDIKPKSHNIHIQAVPKIHIKNINYLTVKHIPMLEHMREKTLDFFKNVLSKTQTINLKELKMGFHIPPFYSIHHLHMHCILPPFKSKWNHFFNFYAFYISIENKINKLKKLKVK